MLILCLDSSGPDLKTGLFEDDRDLAESISDSMGNHSEKIIFEIQQILDRAGKGLDDLNRLAINLGPGSFTGLRIGLAALAGLSLSRNISMDGVNAFEIMAEDIKNAEGRYLAVIPCRGDDFYSTSLISSGGRASRSSEYRIISPARLELPEEKQVLIGSGAERFLKESREKTQEMFELHNGFSSVPSLRSLARLAAGNKIEKYDNLSIPELFYIAPSQAEVNYARKRAGNRNK